MRIKNIVILISKVFHLSYLNSKRHQLSIRASALTYVTVLSIVPFLAVSFFIFKAFGGLTKVAERLEPLILENLATGTGEVVAKQLFQFTQNIHAGAIGGVGLLVLIFTSVSLISKIEDSLNSVWGVTDKKSISRRLTSYWFFLTLGPVIMGLSIALTAYIESSFVIKDTAIVGVMFMQILKWVMTIGFFSLLYYWVPNTLVPKKAALAGGLFAGLLWEFAKFAYTVYALKVVSYSKIYGSLGAFPLFLIWIYITWLIILAGAEISYATFSLKTYEAELQGGSKLSFKNRLEVSILLTVIIAERFLNQKNAPNETELSVETGIPQRAINEMLTFLRHNKFISNTSEGGFVPSYPPEVIKVGKLVRVLESESSKFDILENSKTPYSEKIQKLFAEIDERKYGPIKELNVKDLV